jgi:hypothetical protein
VFSVNARRLVLAVLASLSSLAAGALVGVPAASAAGACPNEQFRVGFSAALPECRAYELVSESGTDPYYATFGTRGTQNIDIGTANAGSVQGTVASVDGSKVAYFSTSAPAEALTYGPYYLASRGPAGWSTEDVIPRQSLDVGLECIPYIAAYSADLSKGILADGWEQKTTPTQIPRDCGHDEPLLVTGEPQGVQNLFVRDGATDAYELVDVTPAGAAPDEAYFQAGSTDLSHVAFDENAQLTPGAPAGDDLYEWVAGVVRLVTVLPDGTPVQGSIANPTLQAGTSSTNGSNDTNAMSDDGSRIFFQAAGNLYLREHADREQSPLGGSGNCLDPDQACTLQLDLSQVGGPDGGGLFRWASADGSRAFFTDENRLTADSNAAPGAPDLYEYNLNAPAGQRLSDRSVDVEAGAHADVLGVAGASEDGSYVYFVAQGVLATSPNSKGDSAVAGVPNLYVAHTGATAFIATLAQNGDSCDWTIFCETARVSPNGLFIGFNSINSLTGYDNAPPLPSDCTGEHEVPRPCQEIFLYDAAGNTLSCASCDSDGRPPTAIAGIRPPEFDNTVSFTPGHLQRNVLDDGRVLFDTYNDVLPADGNEQSDVYEYQAGKLSLLSSPAGSGSFFDEASPSGEDVFIVTDQHLLPGDTASNTGLYDARVDGGFPESAAPTACSEEDCKGAVSPTPLFSTPSSATFVGAGNAAPAVTTKAPVKRVTKGKPRKTAAKRKRSHAKSRRRTSGHKRRRKPGRASARGGIR